MLYKFSRDDVMSRWNPDHQHIQTIGKETYWITRKHRNAANQETMKNRIFTDLLLPLLSASTGAPLAAVLAAVFSLHPTAALAQGAIEAWVQRYDGPGNGPDYAQALAADTNGNVYVTGRVWGGDPLSGGTGMDLATIAYSSAGLPLWTNFYNGPANSHDWANGIARDPGGNVVVTGGSDPGTGPVVTTIKYSNTGAILWTNRQGPSGEGRVAALDAAGNVIVMGPAWSGGCLIIKYSSAGTLLWSKTYSGFTFGDGSPGALAVDTHSDVLVAGSTAPIGGDYLTLKYSSTGSLLWTRRYNGPGNGTDMASGVAVDADGNVFVTGLSASVTGFPTGLNWEYATIKYSSAGVALWTNRYHGPLNDCNDRAQTIAVDAGGNVIVTGWSAGRLYGLVDYATLKYSNSGVPLWTNRCIGDADRASLAVDSNGNVYVTGAAPVTLGAADDYLTFAYSSTGVPLWTNRYSGPGNDSDGPGAIVVDASANVYVTGFSTGSGGGVDWATVKYVTPLRITRQPLSRTNAVGSTASFTVEAVGSLPLSYQWYRDATNVLDGGNFSGTTTANLVLTNVQLADACDYTVVVTNTYGSVTSHVAHLTIMVPSSGGWFTNLAYSPATGFSCIFRDATIGQPYRIQRSPSMAAGTWVDWLNFTYNEPLALSDVGATGAERRFYRAVSP